MSPISYPPRLPLALLPTPLQKLSCSLVPENGELWVKRDDLTDCLSTGNKIRKLEYLLAEARGSDCDTVLTCGGLYSNHARSTAAAAAALGMKTCLFLRGTPPAVAEGNLLLDRILGAHIEYLSAEDYIQRRDEIMRSYAERLSSAGHRPYIIPEGGSNTLGSWGYIAAAEEMAHQIHSLNVPIDGIVCAVGSGGTYTGLWLGTRLLRWNVPIWGINICDTAEYFRERICREIQSAVQRNSFPFSLAEEDIHIVDGYVFEGYSEAPACVLGTIQTLAAETGLILEPVYTAKAFYGMLQEWGRGTFGHDPRLIFLHTGGIFGILTDKYACYYS